MTQNMAVQLVEDYGLPTPPRSLCWMCPNRSDDMWIWMRDNVPEDFEKACNHEKELHEQWDWLWLTKYGVPLADAPLQSSGGRDAQMDIVQYCCSRKG